VVTSSDVSIVASQDVPFQMNAVDACNNVTLITTTDDNVGPTPVTFG
jgi:hypothetical protein